MKCHGKTTTASDFLRHIAVSIFFAIRVCLLFTLRYFRRVLTCCQGNVQSTQDVEPRSLQDYHAHSCEVLGRTRTIWPYSLYSSVLEREVDILSALLFLSSLYVGRIYIICSSHCDRGRVTPPTHGQPWVRNFACARTYE